MAKLVRYEEPKPKRKPGIWKGQGWVSDDFDDDLPDDIAAAAFRGELP